MRPFPRQRKSGLAAAASAAVLAVGLGTQPSPGQIVPDGSLGGDTGPRVGPDYILPAGIGRVSGGNLFHSFGQFRVATGESATFTGPGDAGPIANVIARVTGGELSHLDGLVRVAIPDANFFFVNPAGVTFGPDARLDVGGSVVISSADVLRFADGATFPATADPSPPAVLSTAAPTAFGFLGARPAAVEVMGTSGDGTGGLAAAGGKSLSVVAGDVRIDGGRLVAIGGRVNVASVASPGDVALDVNAATADAVGDLADFAQLGRVELVGRASVETPSGGGIVIRGGALRLERSTLDADNDDTPGGGIDVDVRGDIDVANGRIASDSFGTAPGGAIRLRAGGELRVRGLGPDGVVPPISTNADFNGPGGEVVVDAEVVSLAENAAITSFVQQGASGRGGDIRVTARREFSADGSQSIALTGLAAETFPESSGDSGNITVDAPVVRFAERGEMTSTTRGDGAAGVLTVTGGQLLIDGRNADAAQPGTGDDDVTGGVITGLQSRVGRIGGRGAAGRGGRIDVDVDLLRVTDGGVLSATTFGRGAGGDVEVDATGDVEIAGSDPARFTGIFARTQLPQGGGAGGNVTVRAGEVAVTGAAEISAESTGSGNAGNLAVTAVRSIRLAGGGSVNVSAGFSDPRDGEPEPPTPSLTDSGTITLTAGRDVDLRDGAAVSARATRDSGRVKITAPGVIHLADSRITAEAGRTGGVIDIDPRAVILDHSVINGLAGGQDVSVAITADVFLSSESQILTDTAVLPPEVDIAGSLVRLNAGLSSDAARLQDVCGLQALAEISSFVATGRGGTPPAPGGFAAEVRLIGSR